MKSLFITLLILICAITAFCQHSFTQPLYKIATITFPDTPQTEDKKTSIVYTLTKNGVFYATQAFTESENLDGMFTRHMNDTLYARYIRASINKYNGKLFYKKDITYNGLKGVEYGYKAVVDSVEYYRYRQIFCFNNIFIMNGVSSRDSLPADSKKASAFFNTFKLTINYNKIDQGNLADTIFSGRFAFYLILTIALLIGLVVVFVFVINKVVRK
jgi:hypothetical protein